ncbi:MAG: phage major capsid protein [Candidatus Poribacteria bacterium]|nr:phage major capsid protein [Candidatus Poribacteria bacterium]
MKKSSELSRKMSESRQRLNELVGKDNRSSEESAELETLETEYRSLETEFRAALIAEDDSGESQSTESTEGIELRSLIRGASMADIASAVFSGGTTDGQTAELQQHFSLAPNQVPLELLRMESGELETRAVTPAPANTGRQQQPVIPYVFPMGAAAFLGVSQPTVGIGESVYPVITTPASAKAVAAGASVDETTGAFSADLLSPSRLQASFFYRREDAAKFAQMDSSLRENLSMALMSELDKQVIAGANGFYGAKGLAAPSDPSAEAGYADYQNAVMARVDGRYANEPSDVRMLIGSATLAHAASKYRTNNSDFSGYDEMQNRAGGVRVSSYVPAVASKRQDAIAALGNAMNAVAPIWQGVTLVTDEVTKAKTGEIVLTAFMLHAVKILRSDGFARLRFQVSA